MEASLTYARAQDASDELRDYRKQFYFPSTGEVYFLGNSLGLQPVGAKAMVDRIVDSWKSYAIHGYGEGETAWLTYPNRFKQPLGALVGALPHEVAVMNSLTVNLHLLLASFYRPQPGRRKLLMEAGAFPSDQYAIESQIKAHGLTPEEALIEVSPRPGEKCIREGDLLRIIAEQGDSLALVLIGGVNYYTGQYFDLQTITRAVHENGALAGYDLAHAIGNLPMKLHDWDVDFAIWCSYKYLNGGPGAIGGLYIHERFGMDPTVPRLAGWSGSDLKTRFQMPKTFTPEPGADGWMLSIPPGLALAGLEASLELFHNAGMNRLREKSLRLTGYLEYLLDTIQNATFEIITPRDPEERGAQLSLFFPKGAKPIHTALSDVGITTDYREPGVIRIAPAPLYNNFEDVYRLYEAFHALTKKIPNNH